MPRQPSPEIRNRLVEQAAAMLVAREPLTVRALAERSGTSTMAVYTYFGGLPGLRSAVRQEGFTRLADRLAGLAPTDDPVRDLAALGAAYLGHALAHPDLYRTMFEADVELADPQGADRSFGVLVETAERARAAGRFAADCDPTALATQYWASGHGLAMLALTGVLPQEAPAVHGPALAIALFAAAGDEIARCRHSVAAGWPQ